MQGRAADVDLTAEPQVSDAGRKRAAVELIARHGPALKQAARRYSLSAEDAEDAYQRTMEILLTKAPTERPRDLFAWSRTVIKHEALAIRRSRERLLGAAGREREGEDWIELIPSATAGPDERLQRREEMARSREALRALKPAELRALTLLAEGYSYAEIGAITGFSQTKVNRCLAEGRERFRKLVSSSEDGSRCTELRQLLSRFCDGETSAAETTKAREHLRACAGCRAIVRAYRSAPATVAVLAPALPASRSLLEKAHELAVGIHSRILGGGASTDATVAHTASAGGTKGVGMAALAKLLAVCAGTAGGAAACVATGVVPAPLDLAPERTQTPRIERVAAGAIEEAPPPAAESERAPTPTAPSQEPTQQASPEAVAPAVGSGAIEYPEPAPAPPPVPPPAPETQSTSSGSAAGEFGP